MRRLHLLSALVFSTGVLSCKFFGTLAAGLAGADSSCDRRYGSSDKPQPFCQELIDSVAGSDFREDCANKLKGQASEGACPRTHVIAGCKSNKSNDDDSTVTDWFYDVDKEPDSGVAKEDRIRTKADVRKKCTEPGRYEEGATYVEP